LFCCEIHPPILGQTPQFHNIDSQSGILYTINGTLRFPRRPA
jgi:hypothetical protein